MNATPLAMVPADQAIPPYSSIQKWLIIPMRPTTANAYAT